MTSRQSFADAIVRQGQLWRLLEILHQQDDIEIEASANNFGPGQNDGTGDKSMDSKSIINYMNRRRRDWDFLDSLAANTSIAQTILRSGIWLELLGIIVGYSNFTKLMVARLGGAKVLYKLLWDPENGAYLGKFAMVWML